MQYRELINSLRNLIPTMVLDSLATLCKYKIIPSCEDVNTLREDMIDLGLCVSETDEVVNHNAKALNEESDNTANVLNSHANTIEYLIKRVDKLEKKHKSKRAT